MSFVNAQYTEDADGGLTLAAPAIAAVSGNVLVVHTQYYSTADRTISCSGGGLTWIEDTNAAFYDATDDWGGRVWYAVASSTTNVTATVDYGLGVTYSAVAILQYDSYSSWIGCIDNRQVNPGTGAGAITSGNVDITSQPARQIGIFTNYVAASIPTPVSMTTRISDFSSAFSVIADRQLTATGNTAATATAAGGQGGSTYYSIQIAFAETGGGGGSDPTPLGMLMGIGS